MTEPNEDLVRVVVDTDNRTWHVYVMIEGRKWDPAINKHRRNWLCIESASERRFVSPVPAGWEEWSDTRLRTAIAAAKQDLRGP
jgi:hypothetical protein